MKRWYALKDGGYVRPAYSIVPFQRDGKTFYQVFTFATDPSTPIGTFSDPELAKHACESDSRNGKAA